MSTRCLKITTLACLLNLNMAHSGTLGVEAPCKNAKDSFYVGAGIGAAFDHLDFMILNTTSGFTDETHPNRTHALGNVFAGYGFTAPNQFYLGGEVGTNFPARHNPLTRLGVVPPTPQVFASLSSEDYVTGDLLPGFRCNDFLLYGRVGLAYSRLSYHQDATTIAPVFESQFSQLSERLGLGINYAFSPCISFGADYIYMDYQGSDNFYSGFTAFSITKPHTNYVGLSLIYTV